MKPKWPKMVSIALKQREESVFLCPCTCCHSEWGFVLHSEREVKPSGRSGAEPFGGVQKTLHICWRLSWAHTAPTPVPAHLSHFALLWVSNLCFLLILTWLHLKSISFADISFFSTSGALYFLARSTNRHKGFSKEESVKLWMWGSAWRGFMWWTPKKRWHVFHFAWA